MTVTPVMITLDTTDALKIGHWWAEQTGGKVVAENEGYFVFVALPGGLFLGFQKVPDPTPGKNRLHLDLRADDLQAAVADLQKAGAEHVADREMPGMRWVTLRDPDGNEFCVAETPAGA